MTDAAGRDRLRELLDAVLTGIQDDTVRPRDPRRLGAMAGDAFASPWHFSRQLARGAGEPPVALRRRVLLERAAWQIRCGASVTDAAFAAGYDSVEGFSRAFSRAHGHPPSAVEPVDGHVTSRHWLSAPNGIHFHPPTHLWITPAPKERSGMHVTSHLVHHDVADTRHLLDLAAGLDEAAYRREQLPGTTILAWDGEERSIASVLQRQVFTKEVWLAAIDGDDFPDRGSDDPASLRARHEAVASRWLDRVADIDRRDGWGDVLVDALCDPPESFVMSSVLAHVLTFSAHRRQLVRMMLRQAGLAVDDGDPIDWLRGTSPPDTRAGGGETR